MQTTNNSDFDLLLNPFDGKSVAKLLNPTLIMIIKKYFGIVSDTELGKRLGLKNPSPVINQIKNGRMSLRVEHLKSCAEAGNIDFQGLASHICCQILTIPDASKREAFLAGLQSASNLTEAVFFDRKIGLDRKREFISNGVIPGDWIRLIPDPLTRISFLAAHCSRQNDTKAKRVKDNRRVTHAKTAIDSRIQKKASVRKSDESIMFRELLDASFVAGRASVVNLAEQAFVGDLIRRLVSRFRVTLKPLASRKDAMELELDDGQGNTYDVELDISRYISH